MKEGWKYVKIGEVFKTYAGGTPHKSHNEYYEGGNVPWLMSGEVCQKYISKTECFITEKGLKNSSAKYYPINTVVVAMYGATAAQVGILKVEATSNQAVCGILPSKDYLPEFIYYWFVRIKENLAAQAQGGAQPNLSQVKIKNVEIPFISLPEQQRIVTYLDAEFAKIEALKANAEKQLQAAKDLFQAALKELLTPKEGWVEKKLGELCLSINDGDWIEKKDQSSSGIRLIQTGNIGIGEYRDKTDSAHYISLETFNRLHCEEVFEGDILISRLPDPVGRACVVPHMKTRNITAVDCSILRINKKKINASFLLLYTQSNTYFNKISALCTGSTRQRITRKKLAEIVIPTPPILEQQQIANKLDAISAKVKALQTNYTETITLCNDLKQALLKKVFE